LKGQGFFRGARNCGDILSPVLFFSSINYRACFVIHSMLLSRF
jgi:hypothetical protein